MSLYKDIKRKVGVYDALENLIPTEKAFVQVGKFLTQGLRSKKLMDTLNTRVKDAGAVESAPSTEELHLTGYRQNLTRRFFALKDELVLIEKTTLGVSRSDNGFEKYTETFAIHDMDSQETTTISRIETPSLIGRSAVVTQSSINPSDTTRFLSLIDQITDHSYVAPEHKIYTQAMRPALTFEHTLS